MDFLKKLETKSIDEDTISFRKLFSVKSETEQSSLEKVFSEQ